jgi:hypothetical protein
MADSAQVLPQYAFRRCRHTWRASAGNTVWCLLGCSIGVLGTMLFFQLSGSACPVPAITILAIVNGLLTSIAFETLILFREGMDLTASFGTEFGMSLISMISMEAAINIVDRTLAGGAILARRVIPVMLAAGFLASWPYQYWHLEKWGKACH